MADKIVKFDYCFTAVEEGITGVDFICPVCQQEAQTGLLEYDTVKSVGNEFVCSECGSYFEIVENDQIRILEEDSLSEEASRVEEEFVCRVAEDVAEAFHRQWSNWLNDFLTNSTPENIEKWKMQAGVSYVQLSDEDKAKRLDGIKDIVNTVMKYVNIGGSE